MTSLGERIELNSGFNRLIKWLYCEPIKMDNRLMTYNWQKTDWPFFRYELAEVESDLLSFADRAGHISGMLKGLPEGARAEAMIQLMIAEAMKTSEIEGEYLSRPDVVSSLQNQLGLSEGKVPVKDGAAEGVARLMVDVRRTWSEPLTESRLFLWHEMLLKASSGIKVGRWRTHEEAMQVVLGAIGRLTVHFEAPPSSQVPGEMAAFIRWFNEDALQIKHAPVRAAITHLYFESIHPFEDGNGRIGRALVEKALSQAIGRPSVLSLSQVIQSNKNAYYDALKAGQQSSEVTAWVRYFIGLTLEAQEAATRLVERTLTKARFFDHFSDRLNDRQLRVVRRMFDEGSGGFEGGMNARKYVGLTKASKATATRDLQALVEAGIFLPVGGGRSTRYELNLETP